MFLPLDIYITAIDKNRTDKRLKHIKKSFNYAGLHTQCCLLQLKQNRWGYMQCNTFTNTEYHKISYGWSGFVPKVQTNK